MHIPVILRPNSSVYDLQKLRYRCAGCALKGCGKISMFVRVTVNDSTLVLFLMVKLARNRWEKSCRSYFILNLLAATGVYSRISYLLYFILYYIFYVYEVSYVFLFFCNATLNCANIEDTATHNICIWQCFKLSVFFSSLYIEYLNGR